MSKTYGGKTESELRRIAIAAPDEIGEGDEASLETVAFHNAFMDAAEDLLGCLAATEEAHRRLDNAGIPSAFGAGCNDPTCQTKLGHRVKVLIAERDKYRAAADSLSIEHRRSLKLYNDFYAWLDSETTAMHCAELAKKYPDLEQARLEAAKPGGAA